MNPHTAPSHVQPNPTAHAQHAVLRVSRLPRNYRLAVEEAMVNCLLSAPENSSPGVDPLSAPWFTRWERDPSRPRSVRCREVITGTGEELGLLRKELGMLAAATECEADLQPVA